MAISTRKTTPRSMSGVKKGQGSVVVIKDAGSYTIVKRNQAGDVASIEFLKNDDPSRVIEASHRVYSEQELCDAEDAKFFNSFLPKKNS